MTPSAVKQGKFGSLGAMFLFIFLPCMWGLGSQKELPFPHRKFRKFRVAYEFLFPLCKLRRVLLRMLFGDSEKVPWGVLTLTLEHSQCRWKLLF